jgi:hypothetical protein
MHMGVIYFLVCVRKHESNLPTNMHTTVGLAHAGRNSGRHMISPRDEVRVRFLYRHNSSFKYHLFLFSIFFHFIFENNHNNKKA